MSLLERYQQTRARTESLCEPLEVEDYIPQAVDFASPPKWHLAHVTWFFEEMILKSHLGDYVEYDPQYGFLFNSYYQTLGERTLRSQRGVITRPTVKDVYSYRKHVDNGMNKILAQQLTSEVEALIVLGINHEQQHQELLITDLKYVFGLNPTFPIYQKDTNFLDDTNTDEGWLSIAEGNYEIGYADDGFYFDNEKGRHTVHLDSYQIARGLVTNAEYIEFIDAGGYENFQYWLDDGWSWLDTQQIKHPLYWHRIDGEWFYYTLAGLKPINPDAMLCHVSFYETYAYAAWRGKRLATEFEWEVAANQLVWGKRWEWTASAYQAYPGFAISEGAVGEYNGKFMINQMVLRGASVATTEGHSRSTYRNFFQPFMQWQYSGIRLAK